MKDSREYKVLIASKGFTSSVWACNISHDQLIDGIRNGGLRYLGGNRQEILDFVATRVVTEDAITCGGRFGCE